MSEVQGTKTCPDCNRPKCNQSLRCGSCNARLRWLDPEVRARLAVGRQKRICLNQSRFDPLTSEQEQVVIGSLFGDGCIKQATLACSPVFAETHAEPQIEYLRWKAAILATYNPLVVQRYPARKRILISRIRFCKPTWEMVTKGSMAFAPYRASFYPDGIKIVPIEMLEAVGPLALAVWCMDDGSRAAGRHFVLCTDSWPYDQQEILVSWFRRRWGVDPAIQQQARTRLFRLRFRVDDSTILLRIILPHLHPMFVAKWKLADPETLRPAMSRADRCTMANKERTRLINAGILTVGYHTGTIRITESL